MTRVLSSSTIALFLSACGTAPSTPPPEPSSNLDLEGWTGARAAPEDARAVAEPAAPIELARGETFESLVALTHTPMPDATTACAVYSIRATDGGLQEGRRTIDCPAEGLAAVSEDRIRFRDVEEQRRLHLQAALSGAVATPADVDVEGDHVRVRLVTDARELEGDVPQPRWPTPYAEESEAPRGTPPQNIAELWEAVMFPHRYAAAPVVARTE